jgi:hypothetical protein
MENAEDQRFGSEIKSAVRLDAVQEATEFEDAVLVGSLLDAQKLALLVRRGGLEINRQWNPATRNWL